MLFPPNKKFEGSAEIGFFSQGIPQKFGYPEDLHALHMQLSPSGGLRCGFSAFTIDPDFADKTRRFFGEIKVAFDEAFIARRDCYELALVNVVFVFPKDADGRQEILSVFVDGGMLPYFREVFHC